MIMETRDRCSYPDSPHSGYGHPSDWIAKPYSIMFTVVGLFILIFGIAIFLGWRQFETARHNALIADKTTTNLLADLILEHNKATMGILQSYAHRPLFITAVKNKDLAGAYRHLSDLKKNAEIDMTFVVDKRGILLVNFPMFPESMGKDLSYRDWYKGVSSHWKPFISTVFKLIVRDKPLAVAVCVPIFDEKGRPIGILGDTQRLSFLDAAIKRMPFSPYTTVNVIDRAGHILYSNKFPYQESITDYRFFPILEAAVKEKKQQIEMNDPQKDQEKHYLTVVPVGDIGWSVIVERSLRDIYRSDLRRFIEIGAVSFLSFLLITFFLVYLRKATIFRKTEELLHAETKLRQEEEKLRALSSRQEAILAAVPEIIMEVDNNKVYTWANKPGMDFFGEDVIGKEAAFYFEGEQDTYDTVSPLFNGAEDIIYVESYQRRRDGEKRLLAWWCRVLKDENGQVTGALSSARDITERKRAEEMLRRSEENFRYSLADSPMGVRIVTIEGETIYANRTILNIYGYDSMEDLITTPVKTRYTPESFAEHQIRKEKRKRGDNAPSEYTISIIRKDGETRYLQVFRKEILWDGERQFQVLYNDITERKQAEEALSHQNQLLRTILDSIPVMVALLDREGHYQLVNRFWQSTLGWSLEKAQHNDVLAKLYPDPVYRKYVVDYIAATAGTWSDFKTKTCDGRVLDTSWVNVPLLDGSKIGIGIDITERKRTEKELSTSHLQLRKLATRLQQIREEERLMIAREIHDEMGGGLTGLKMDLSWLLGKVGDADSCEERVVLMDRIHTSNALIDHMIRVVRRISTDLRPSVLDDLGLIAALEWQLSEFTSRTEIPHEFDTTFEYVNMEKDTAVAVFRIFQEALTNVVRHSRATKVAVFLREGERSLFGDESLVLEIRDNGKGITKEEILNPESLGLLGMKERVLTFGGELSIRGELGGGTALVLQIPRKQGEAS
jgi:PAS domain S-box-containing protein